jgi:hypothetical protein
MEWLNYVSLETGVLGAVLGIRSELWRRKEYSTKQEDRQTVEAEKQRDCIMAARNVLAAARAIPLREASDLLTQDAAKIEASIQRLAKVLEIESAKIAKTSDHLLPALYELPSLCDRIVQYVSAEGRNQLQISSEHAYMFHGFWLHLWEISLLPVLTGAKGQRPGSLAAVEADGEVADLASRRDRFHEYYLDHLFERPKLSRPTNDA